MMSQNALQSRMARARFRPRAATPGLPSPWAILIPYFIRVSGYGSCVPQFHPLLNPSPSERETTFFRAPRKSSKAARATGSISVGACPMLGTATSPPEGRAATMRRARGSERTSLSIPHPTKVGHATRWRKGDSGGPCSTRCWVYVGSVFQTQRPSGGCRGCSWRPLLDAFKGLVFENRLDFVHCGEGEDSGGIRFDRDRSESGGLVA